MWCKYIYWFVPGYEPVYIFAPHADFCFEYLLAPGFTGSSTVRTSPADTGDLSTCFPFLNMVCHSFCPYLSTRCRQIPSAAGTVYTAYCLAPMSLPSGYALWLWLYCPFRHLPWHCNNTICPVSLKMVYHLRHAMPVSTLLP